MTQLSIDIRPAGLTTGVQRTRAALARVGVRLDRNVRAIPSTAMTRDYEQEILQSLQTSSIHRKSSSCSSSSRFVCESSSRRLIDDSLKKMPRHEPHTLNF